MKAGALPSCSVSTVTSQEPCYWSRDDEKTPTAQTQSRGERKNLSVLNEDRVKGYSATVLQ